MFPRTAINPIERNKEIKALSDAIQAEPRLQIKGSFTFFPFSNERHIAKTIKKLSQIPPLVTTKKRVAILTGESKLLSILPELSLHADSVLCNDINTDMHKHTRFLIECLKKSANRNEFIDNYQKKTDGEYDNPATTNETMTSLLSDLTNSYAGEKFFLSSDERFFVCKKALEKLHFSWSHINLYDPYQCQVLKQILQEHHALITLLNLSNLHSYALDSRESYKQAINILTANNPCPIIMYSLGSMGCRDVLKLRSKIDIGTREYENIVDELNQSQKKHPFEFSYLQSRYKHMSSDEDFIKLANQIIRISALRRNISLHFVPFLKTVNGKIRFDLEKMSQEAHHIPLQQRHDIYMLLRDIFKWKYRKYLDEEKFFSLDHGIHTLTLLNYIERNFSAEEDLNPLIEKINALIEKHAKKIDLKYSFIPKVQCINHHKLVLDVDLLPTNDKQLEYLEKIKQDFYPDSQSEKLPHWKHITNEKKGTVGHYQSRIYIHDLYRFFRKKGSEDQCPEKLLKCSVN